jgi:hypothetical protein
MRISERPVGEPQPGVVRCSSGYKPRLVNSTALPDQCLGQISVESIVKPGLAAGTYVGGTDLLSNLGGGSAAEWTSTVQSSTCRDNGLSSTRWNPVFSMASDAAMADDHARQPSSSFFTVVGQSQSIISSGRTLTLR